MLKKMKQVHFNKKQLQLAAFLSSVFIGTVYANVIVSKDVESYRLIIDFFLGRIRSNSIIKIDLLQYLIFERFKLLLILWLLGFVLLTPVINKLIVSLIGFFYGAIFSSVLIINGFSGYILFVLFLFPHAFVYVPVFLFLSNKSEEFSKSIYNNRKSLKGFKIGGQLMVEYFLVLAISSVFLMLGIYLEAFTNSDLLQWYLQQK